MKKTLLAMAGIALSCSAYANISIYPYSLEFNASGKSRMESVRIINGSDQAQTYRVSLVNYEQAADGSQKEVTGKTPDWSAEPFLSFSPRQFTLKPHEVQTVNVIRKPSAKMDDGEYVARLKVAEQDMKRTKPKPKTEAQEKNEKTLSIELTALYAVTIPVTVTKGDLKYNLDVEGAKLSADGKDIQVTMKRGGDKSAIGDVIVQNKAGKEVALGKSVRVYAMRDKMTTSIPLIKDAKIAKGEKVKVLFEDRETKKIVAEKEASL